MKEKLLLIEEKDFLKMSSDLSKNLSFLLDSLNVIQSKNCIGTFAPIAGEPFWYLELSKEIENLTAYPVMKNELMKSETKNGLMAFKMAAFKDLVVNTDFGVKIKAPPEDRAEVLPSCLLIPGLVFTTRGERLGRGRGFYDRYLENYQGIKMGICFSIQIQDSIPVDKHDVSLDYIVTEKEILNCKL